MIPPATLTTATTSTVACFTVPSPAPYGAGSLFRRAWTIEDAEGETWEAFLEDATLTGMTLAQLEMFVAERVLVQGRYGLLAGWNIEEGRPYISGWNASQIRDWFFDVGDGRRRRRWIIASIIDNAFTIASEGILPVGIRVKNLPLIPHIPRVQKSEINQDYGSTK